MPGTKLPRRKAARQLCKAWGSIAPKEFAQRRAKSIGGCGCPNGRVMGWRHAKPGHRGKCGRRVGRNEVSSVAAWAGVMALVQPPQAVEKSRHKQAEPQYSLKGKVARRVCNRFAGPSAARAELSRHTHLRSCCQAILMPVNTPITWRSSSILSRDGKAGSSAWAMNPPAALIRYSRK